METRSARTARITAIILLLLLAAVGRAAAQAPGAPTPLGPPDGSSVQVPFAIPWSPTVAVGDPNGGYNWQVSGSSSFASLVLMDSTSPAVTEDVVSGLVPGTYFWRVQAANASGQSAWSQPLRFVVTGAGPGTPGTPILAPTQGYSTFHPWEVVRFNWTAVIAGLCARPLRSPPHRARAPGSGR